MEGIVRAVCLSKARGTEKVNVGRGELQADWGLAGDAHVGHWHRQVSLLSADKISAFNAKGANVQPGAFGENLVVEGLDFRAMPVGTRLRCGQVFTGWGTASCPGRASLPRYWRAARWQWAT